MLEGEENGTKIRYTFRRRIITNLGNKNGLCSGLKRHPDFICSCCSASAFVIISAYSMLGKGNKSIPIPVIILDKENSVLQRKCLWLGLIR